MKSNHKRILIVMAAAISFGVAVAVLKGGSADIRDALGNVSAPWLLLPYLAGTVTRGPARGALMGTVACLIALLAFYVAQAFVLDLGGHPVLTNLALTLGAGRMYYAAGIACAPLFGALGGLHVRSRTVVTATVVGLLLMGEPVAVFAWLAHAGISPSDSGFVTAYPALWIGEVLLGFVLWTGMLTTNMRRSRTP